MIKTNYHTHTIYCDGKNTPEELVITAINKGFTSLGFSGHSYFERDKDFSMNCDNEARYYQEVSSLKEKYEKKIKIFCGIEQDIFSPPSKLHYDFAIGSVHNVYKNGEYLVVDGSLNEIKEILEKHYDNNFDEFAKDYFETVSNVVEKTRADIIGHFDLILKNMERLHYEPSDIFFKYAEMAVVKLIKFNKPFEINTGAMARGYRTAPYPHKTILEMIFNNGGNIIFSSDCHNKEYLDFGYEQAEQLALEVGFKKQAIITQKGIEYVEI